MNTDGARHPGGRPKGVKGQRLDCLFKRCPCARRRWSECPHSWCYAIGYDGRGFRGTLNKYFGLPRFYQMSRSEAQALLDKIWVAVRAGEYRPQQSRTKATGGHAATGPLTFRDVSAVYVREFKADPNRRPHRGVALDNQLKVINRTAVNIPNGGTVEFGDLPFGEIRTHHIEAWRDGRRELMRAKEQARLARAQQKANGTPKADLLVSSPEVPHSRHGELGINRHLEVIRRVFNWAIVKGYRDSESPFTRFNKRVIRFAPQKPRTRRLLPGEEERLLAAAAPHLKALIVAALETGCRRGELLSLQWADVRCNEKGEPRMFSLRSENTKTDTARTVPVSPRLRAVLEMRRSGPDGKPHGPDRFVFGNEVGERVGEFKLAWRGACQRADITGLTFHDLRRENGSRLVEGGVNLLTVSRLLGHRRVSTTDTYLKASEGIAERELQRYHDRQDGRSGSTASDDGSTAS